MANQMYHLNMYIEHNVIFIAMFNSQQEGVMVVNKPWHILGEPYSLPAPLRLVGFYMWAPLQV